MRQAVGPFAWHAANHAGRKAEKQLNKHHGSFYRRLGEASGSRSFLVHAWNTVRCFVSCCFVRLPGQ